MKFSSAWAAALIGCIDLASAGTSILSGYNGDPNIAVFGDTYYIYPTTDQQSGATLNFYAYSSTDLVTWTRTTDPILILDGSSAVGHVPWATKYAWSPTIIERNGLYYFYFSGYNPNSAAEQGLNIGVAYGSSPTGPFTSTSEPIITNLETVHAGVAIDPCAFHDPSTGNYYLFWGNGNHLWAQLSDDMLSLETAPAQVELDLPSGWNSSDTYEEAPFVVYRNGMYHLTYAIDVTTSENYRVGYATAWNPTGPYTARSVILRENASLGILGPGSASVLQIPDTDDWYMAYHHWAIPNGSGTERQVTLDKISIDSSTGYFETVTPTLSTVGPETVP